MTGGLRRRVRLSPLLSTIAQTDYRRTKVASEKQTEEHVLSLLRTLGATNNLDEAFNI